MDTGIGKSAYSVMEQGRMDLILSTSPEDRRYIFEEAAGISRYKLQKKESLRRLEETNENLMRVNDLIKEIEREKDFKARQADKTKEYLVLKERRKDCDIKLSILKFRELERKIEKILNDIAKLDQEREKISARIASISSENEIDERRNNDIQSRIWELGKRLDEYKIRVDEIDSKIAKNRDLITEQRENVSGIEKKILYCQERKKEYIGEKEKTEQSGAEIKAKMEAENAARAQSFAARKAKLNSIHASRDNIDKNKMLIKDHERQLTSLRDELEVVIRQLIQAIDQRKAE
ncbi:MAG: hypothetical protein LBT84_01295, partial [Spirochaetia bacterium]|nr:hypothetical protein [Spirochaetia bacterium]